MKALIAAAVLVAGLVAVVLVSTGRGSSRSPVLPSRGVSVYDPVAAGEDLPDGYRSLLPRDAILPVYSPEFVPAGEAGWRDDTLVIGVAIGGEAKAYPVSFLNRREMVNDRLSGVPLLVSW